MQGFLKEGQWYPTYILYIIYIYIYICLASCTKPLISDVDFLCEGWCVAWTPTSLLPSTKKTATEQWPNPCLLNVFFHFGVIVIPQTDACILYIYIIHMISLNRCPLSFDLPFVVFEGTLIKSYKSIMIWIWNVIICFPILHWAFLLLRPLRVESEVRCRGMDFFLRPQRGQPPGICVTSKWSCFFPLPSLETLNFFLVQGRGRLIPPGRNSQGKRGKLTAIVHISTWRIIPVSKWLITMDSKSPK